MWTCQCGAENPATAKFCAQCGAPAAQAPAQAPPTSEATPPSGAAPQASTPAASDTPENAKTMRILAAVMVVVGIATLVVNDVINLDGLSGGDSANTAEKEQAKGLIVQAMDKLSLYKTNKSANADQPNLITEANTLATQAHGLHATPKAKGLMLLTQVWGNRWHLMSSDDYVSSTWAQDDQATAAEVAQSDDAAAHLARTIVLAYGCHLQGNPNPDNQVCNSAVQAFNTTKSKMTTAPGWLRFELVWMEADFWWRHGMYTTRKKNRTKANQAWSNVMQVCNSPYEPPSSGPVNDIELYEPCLYASGALEDYVGWIKWAHQWRQRDIQQHRRTRGTTMKAIFRSAHPSCRSPRLKLRRVRGYKNYPRIEQNKNKAHAFCAAAGMIALDCYRHVDSFTHLRYAVPELIENWDQLMAASRVYGTIGECYLDKR